MAQTIIVDISTRGANPVAYTHQGDTGRTFFAEIYDNGEAFAVAGYTIKVGAILPADRGYYVIAGNDMVTATKTNDNTTNKIYFTLSDKYSLKAGNGILTLIFTSNTGTPSTIRPINIDLRIQKSADADDTVLGASDWPTGLYDYMDDWLAENEPTEIANLKSDLLELQNGGYVADAQRIGEVIDGWLDDHPEATTTVQDGAITEVKFADSLKLKAIKDYVTPEMYGAKGDGTTNDTQAWKDAIATGKIIVAINQYLCTEPLSLDNSTYIFGIVYNDVTDGIIIDGKLRKEYKIDVRSKQQTSDNRTGLTVKNCNECSLSINSRNFYIGSLLVGDGTGCAYNTINKVDVQNSKYHLVYRAKNNGWCNENYTYNVRLIGESNSLYDGNDYGITLDHDNSTHYCNANNFLNVCAEGSYCAIHCGYYTRDNTFENIRTEGCTYAAIFDAKTIRNIVYVGYGTKAFTSETSSNAVIDILNKIENNFIEIAKVNGLKNSTASTATNATASGAYRVGHTGIIYRSIYNTTADTDGIKSKGTCNMGFLISTATNKTVCLRADCVGNWRPIVVPFDSNGDFISDATIDTGGFKWGYNDNDTTGKSYDIGANMSGSRTVLIKLDARTASALIGVGTFSSNVIFRSYGVYGDASNYLIYKNEKPSLGSKPTSTGYFVGQEVYSTASAFKWVWDGTSWVDVNLT